MALEPLNKQNENNNLNNSQLTMMHEFNLTLNSIHNIQDILKESADMIRKFMKSDGCHIFLTQKIKDALQLNEAIHEGGKSLFAEIDDTKGIIRLTLEKKQIIVVTNIEKDRRIAKKIQEYFEYKSMISVPIILKGQAIGVLLVYSKYPNQYNSRDGQFLMMLGNHLGLAIENIKLMQELKKAVLIDPLTGAYNYRYFRNELEKIVSQQPDDQISLIMLDLNDFKEINDGYGHIVGDFVLKEITRILKKNIRGNDAVVRNGGDEFAVILPGASKEEAYQVAVRIEEAVSQHTFIYDKQEIQTSVSWGSITSYCKNVSCINKLIDLADKKLYKMKKKKCSE